jgi:serine/threonine-protein kinase
VQVAAPEAAAAASAVTSLVTEESTGGTTAGAASNDTSTTPATPAAQTAQRPRAAERVAARDVRETPARDAKPRAAAATGVLQLAVTPWGQVDIDGKSAGVTPPLAQLTLSVGEHVITVRNEDFAPHTVTVRVSADQPVTVRHRFGS